MQRVKLDNLLVLIYERRLFMGLEATLMVSDKIRELLAVQNFVNIIFAAAPSQNEFLMTLIEQKDYIEWQRVNAFHMDEYIGLPERAPQLFGSFLEEKIFSQLPFRTVNYLNGNAADPNAECERYAELLVQNPPDIICLGIGENGHIAFNDPHVADFNDPKMVKIVDLDYECRQQQVNDGCFVTLDAVPTHALTLTVPALMSGKTIYCIVPGRNKANAVKNTITGKVSEACPASILTKHPNTILFLDNDSASTYIDKINRL